MKDFEEKYSLKDTIAHTEEIIPHLIESAQKEDKDFAQRLYHINGFGFSQRLNPLTFTFSVGEKSFPIEHIGLYSLCCDAIKESTHNPITGELLLPKREGPYYFTSGSTKFLSCFSPVALCWPTPSRGEPLQYVVYHYEDGFRGGIGTLGNKDDTPVYNQQRAEVVMAAHQQMQQEYLTEMKELYGEDAYVCYLTEKQVIGYDQFMAEKGIEAMANQLSTQNSVDEQEQ